MGMVRLPGGGGPPTPGEFSRTAARGRPTAWRSPLRAVEHGGRERDLERHAVDHGGPEAVAAGQRRAAYQVSM